jgi:hypothetical protein
MRLATRLSMFSVELIISLLLLKLFGGGRVGNFNVRALHFLPCVERVWVGSPLTPAVGGPRWGVCVRGIAVAYRRICFLACSFDEGLCMPPQWRKGL